MFNYRYKFQALPNVVVFNECVLTRNVNTYPVGTKFDIIAISSSGHAFFGDVKTGHTNVLNLIELGIAVSATEDEVRHFMSRQIAGFLMQEMSNDNN